MLADATLRRCYDAAVTELRSGESYALPVPTSYDVVSQCRREGVPATPLDVHTWCRRHGLRLADARSEFA